MPNRRAWGTALCMQIFSSIGARRRDFEPLLVFGTVFRLIRLMDFRLIRLIRLIRLMDFPVNPVNPVNPVLELTGYK